MPYSKNRWAVPRSDGNRFAGCPKWVSGRIDENVTVVESNIHPMEEQLRDALWHGDCQIWDKPNVYIVQEGACTLVDYGWPVDTEAVRAGLTVAGFGPGDVDRVRLTHYDADHVGSLAGLRATLDAPVYVHQEDAPIVAGDRLPAVDRQKRPQSAPPIVLPAPQHSRAPDSSSPKGRRRVRVSPRPRFRGHARPHGVRP